MVCGVCWKKEQKCTIDGCIGSERCLRSIMRCWLKVCRQSVTMTRSNSHQLVIQYFSAHRSLIRRVFGVVLEPQKLVFAQPHGVVHVLTHVCHCHRSQFTVHTSALPVQQYHATDRRSATTSKISAMTVEHAFVSAASVVVDCTVKFAFEEEEEVFLPPIVPST